jgi:archaeosortase B (VPXXXP-CTERM-specific)
MLAISVYTRLFWRIESRIMVMSARKKGTKGKEQRTPRKKGAQKDVAPQQETRTMVSVLVEKASENREAITYVAFFLSLCLVFYFFYYYISVSGSVLMVRLREFTASLLGSIFSAAGADVVVNGALVFINGFGLEIIDECTAVFSSIVYSACILAYPTTPRKKVVGVAFGIPALYAINILRLVILAQVGLFRPALFEFVHVYLWQASFIIFVVVIFLLWLKLVVKE